MTPAILICSREESTREALKGILAPVFPLIVIEDGDQCLAAVKQNAPPAFAFVGTSVDDAGEFFKNLRKTSPKLTVIAVGEDGSEDNAVAAVSQGASGYTMLPLRKNDILAMAQKSARP